MIVILIRQKAKKQIYGSSSFLRGGYFDYAQYTQRQGMLVQEWGFLINNINLTKAKNRFAAAQAFVVGDNTRRRGMQVQEWVSK